MRSPDGQAGDRPAKVLIVVAGPAKGTTIPVAGELRLGRAEKGGDLAGDPTLSRHHAVLRQQPDGLTWIEDLGSANGTFVNGHRVRGIRRLEVGDTIEVGKSKLRLSAGPEDAPASPADAEPSAQPEPKRRSPVREGWPRRRGGSSAGGRMLRAIARAGLLVGVFLLMACAIVAAALMRLTGGNAPSAKRWLIRPCARAMPRGAR
jgi:FHA domain